MAPRAGLRTCDHSINSRMLYQLSYRGSCRSAGGDIAENPAMESANFGACLGGLAARRGSATIAPCPIRSQCPELLTPAEMGEADRMTIAGGVAGHRADGAGRRGGRRRRRRARRAARGRVEDPLRSRRQRRRRFHRRPAARASAAIASNSSCWARARRCAAIRRWPPQRYRRRRRAGRGVRSRAARISSSTRSTAPGCPATSTGCARMRRADQRLRRSAAGRSWPSTCPPGSTARPARCAASRCAPTRA